MTAFNPLNRSLSINCSLQSTTDYLVTPDKKIVFSNPALLVLSGWNELEIDLSKTTNPLPADAVLSITYDYSNQTRNELSKTSEPSKTSGLSKASFDSPLALESIRAE